MNSIAIEGALQRLQALAEEISMCKKNIENSALGVMEIDGEKECLLPEGVSLRSLLDRIEQFAKERLFLPRTSSNIGCASLSERVRALGSEIFNEWTSSPGTIPHSLIQLQELVALSVDAIQNNRPLPMLSYEIKEFNSSRKNGGRYHISSDPHETPLNIAFSRQPFNTYAVSVFTWRSSSVTPPPSSPPPSKCCTIL